MNPNDIKITDTSPTLEELKIYRAAWLSDARMSGVLDLLFEAGSKLAEGDQPTYPHMPFDPSRAFSRLVCDGFTIHYNLDMVDNFTAGRTSWGLFEKVIVTTGGQAPHEMHIGNNIKWVASLYRGVIDGGEDIETAIKGAAEKQAKLDKEEKNYILPGDWQNFILTDIKSRLDEIKIEESVAAEETERQELINLLGLGETK